MFALRNFAHTNLHDEAHALAWLVIRKRSLSSLSDKYVHVRTETETNEPSVSEAVAPYPRSALMLTLYKAFLLLNNVYNCVDIL
jgi:hypothetical protein